MNTQAELGESFYTAFQPLPSPHHGPRLSGYSVSSEKPRSCWRREVLSQQRGPLPPSHGLAHLAGRVLGPRGQGRESTDGEGHAGGEFRPANLEAGTPADQLTGDAFLPTQETQQGLEEAPAFTTLVHYFCLHLLPTSAGAPVFRQASCCF